MSTPGNIFIDGVYLHSSSDGDALPMLVQKILLQERRWMDASYLARIIFSEMIKNDIGGELGYGISQNIGANTCDVIAISAVSGGCCVGYVEPNDHNISNMGTRFAHKKWDFQAYISEPEIDSHFNVYKYDHEF